VREIRVNIQRENGESVKTKMKENIAVNNEYQYCIASIVFDE
jgi:hypothetical protein